MEDQLREVLGTEGQHGGLASPEHTAKGYAWTVPGDQAVGVLLHCLSGAHGLADPLLAPPPEQPQSMPFTELEALTLVVRLLGADSGDFTENSLSAATGGSSTPRGCVAELLRCREATLVVLLLLERQLPQLERQKDQHMFLAALSALRLQLLPAAPGTLIPWWVEEDIGHRDRGTARRRLVGTVLRAIGAVGDHLSCRLQIVAMGCLHALVTQSPDCRALAHLRGAPELVTQLLRAKLYAASAPKRLELPGLEAALIAACKVLMALAPGPRKHVSCLGQLGLEADAVVMLRRYILRREIAVAAFALLCAVAHDQAAAARLVTEPMALAAADDVRARWPQAVKEAMLPHTQPMAPVLKTLLAGAHAPSASMAKTAVLALEPCALLAHAPAPPTKSGRLAALRAAGGATLQPLSARTQFVQRSQPTRPP